MNLSFGVDLDHGAYPGPLGDRQAVAGEAWVGPLGLLGTLETHLGLGGPWESHLLRAASLVPAALAADGFWSASAEQSPLATARTLLGWRDLLWTCGWRGQGGCPRLAQLARVTADVRPGVPDRLLAVLHALEQQRPDISRVELIDEPRQLPMLWRKVLARLEERGVAVDRSRPETACAAEQTDLGRAQRTAEDEAQGDGSLLLLRPYGPLAAAEEVAAWISATEGDGELVILGPEPILDRALHRFGLATTGASDDSGSGSLSQLLPLVLELGWKPADPNLALELLTLPTSPVPAPLARRLAGALQEWPAVASPAWDEAMEEGLARLDRGDEERQRLKERSCRLFDGSVPRDQPYPRAEIEERLDLLDTWLRARIGTASRADTAEAAEAAEAGTASATSDAGPSHDLGPHLLATLEQTAILRELLDRTKLSTVTMAQLHRLASSALQAASPPAPLPHEAGVHVIGKPGGLAGPVDRLVWWPFRLDAVETRTRLPLTAAELDELAALGVEMPDLAEEALFEARRWRRALSLTRKSLLLVCPRTGSNGDELYPHPLWDQISSFVGKPERLQTPRAAAASRVPRRQPPFQAPPAPRRRWTTSPHLLAPREAESPSSLGTLLGCSLSWGLQYKGRVGRGLSAPLATSNLLQGRLAHEILRRVLSAQPTSPATARDEAERIFGELGECLAAPLFLPGNRAALDETRRVCTNAAGQIVEHLRESGLEVLAAEAPLQGEVAGMTVSGRVDLVVGRPVAVVDFKWGGVSRLREELKTGTAYQPALYAQLYRAEASDPHPEIAYFVLVNGTLFASGNGVFRRAQQIDGPSPERTVQALVSSHAERRRELDLGELEAAGVRETEDDVTLEKSELSDEELQLLVAPKCRFCEFAALCGHRFDDVQ